MTTTSTNKPPLAPFTPNPNDWADPNTIYSVVVRLPKAGERCLTGAKITTMTQDMDFSKYPVIVGEEPMPVSSELEIKRAMFETAVDGIYQMRSMPRLTTTGQEWEDFRDDFIDDVTEDNVYDKARSAVLAWVGTETMTPHLAQ